jgi:uncharacterized protein (TIGR02996 family)
MTDADFLQQIAANPDDLTLRLVYADWLEERGDPRAEFLRVRTLWSQASPGERKFSQLYHQLAELRQTTSPDWIATVEGHRGIEDLEQEQYLRFTASAPLVLVHHWASWSTPDRRLRQMMPLLATNWYPHVRFGGLNVDDYPEHSMILGISTIPLVLWYGSGKELKRTHFQVREVVESQIRQHFGLA